MSPALAGGFFTTAPARMPQLLYSSCRVSRSDVSNSVRPQDCGPPASSVHGVLPTRILEWGASLQRILLTQGSNLGLLHCRQILYRLSYREDPNCCMYWYEIAYLCDCFRLLLNNRIFSSCAFILVVLRFTDPLFRALSPNSAVHGSLFMQVL